MLNQPNWYVADSVPIEGNRYLLVERHYDVEQVVSALVAAGIELDKLEFVVAGDEFSVVAAAVLSAAFGLPGMSVATAIACRDKDIQKRVLRSAGIACADSLRLEPPHGAEAPPADTVELLPGVLKPVAGASTAGVVPVLDDAGLAAELASPERRVAGPLLLERRIDGRELCADGFIVGGQLQLLALSRYRHNLLDIREGKLPTLVSLDARQYPDFHRSAARLVTRALAAVGLADGVFHIELFDTKQGLVIGELAARAGGALVVDAVHRKYGVNLQHARACVTLGLPQPAREEPSAEAVGFTFLGLPPGTIRDMPGVEEVLARPGIELATIDLRVGDAVPDARVATSVRAGIALLTALTEAELERRMDDLQAWFTSRSYVVGEPGCE